MNKGLHTFYLRHIRPADPGFFLARYAAKAALSCMAAFITAFLAGLEGEILFWWMAGAVCTTLFRTGSTLKRRKIYALVLLGAVCLTVPAAAVLGQALLPGLGFIFLLAFACFFVGSAGLSASTIGNGCLIVSLISVFSPVPGLEPALLRSAGLFCGGLVSFFTLFYIHPFDPEKALSASAKLAVEDLGFFLDKVTVRLGKPGTGEEIPLSAGNAIGSVRRYRSFLESFNIDPLKGVGASGGPGLFYYSLVRMYEAVVGLSNHIHFSDNRTEFDRLREHFLGTAMKISHAFNRFSRLERDCFCDPGFDELSLEIDHIRNTLLAMGGYRKGDAVREKFQDAWAAAYALKNVLTEFRDMQDLARDKFPLGRS